MTKVGQIFRENLADTIKGGLKENDNVFLLSYTRLSGTKMSELRKSLKNAGADVYASKNSIARRALKDCAHEGLAEKVGGETAFVWSNEDSSAISKILVNFAKDCEQLVIQGGLLEGRVLEQTDVQKLSDLPPRSVLLAQLLGTIQAPLTRLAGALNAKSRDLLSILKQLSEQKEKE